MLFVHRPATFHPQTQWQRSWGSVGPGQCGRGLSLKSMKPAKQISGAGTQTNIHAHQRAQKQCVCFGHGPWMSWVCLCWLKDLVGSRLCRQDNRVPSWLDWMPRRKNLWHALTKLHQKFTAHDTVPPPNETAFVKHKIPWGGDPCICRPINRKNRCFPTPCFTERAGVATKLIKSCTEELSDLDAICQQYEQPTAAAAILL